MRNTIFLLLLFFLTVPALGQEGSTFLLSPVLPDEALEVPLKMWTRSDGTWVLGQDFPKEWGGRKTRQMEVTSHEGEWVSLSLRYDPSFEEVGVHEYELRFELDEYPVLFLLSLSGRDWVWAQNGSFLLHSEEEDSFIPEGRWVLLPPRYQISFSNQWITLPFGAASFRPSGDFIVGMGRSTDLEWEVSMDVSGEVRVFLGPGISLGRSWSINGSPLFLENKGEHYSFFVSSPSGVQRIRGSLVGLLDSVSRVDTWVELHYLDKTIRLSGVVQRGFFAGEGYVEFIGEPYTSLSLSNGQIYRLDSAGYCRISLPSGLYSVSGGRVFFVEENMTTQVLVGSVSAKPLEQELAVWFDDRWNGYLRYGSFFARPDQVRISGWNSSIQASYSFVGEKLELTFADKNVPQSIQRGPFFVSIPSDRGVPSLALTHDFGTGSLFTDFSSISGRYRWSFGNVSLAYGPRGFFGMVSVPPFIERLSYDGTTLYGQGGFTNVLWSFAKTKDKSQWEVTFLPHIHLVLEKAEKVSLGVKANAVYEQFGMGFAWSTAFLFSDAGGSLEAKARFSLPLGEAFTLMMIPSARVDRMQQDWSLSWGMAFHPNPWLYVAAMTKGTEEITWRLGFRLPL